jgi:hypothetical protein
MDTSDEPSSHEPSFRGSNGSVGVAVSADVVQVRDSNDPRQAVLSFTPRQWDAFVQGVQDREFDIR